MLATRSNTFYRSVVDVTHQYLGPAAERFVSRQIRNHLNKEPEKLQPHELHGLVDWLSLAMAMLSGDESLVQQYKAELHQLAEDN